MSVYRVGALLFESLGKHMHSWKSACHWFPMVGVRVRGGSDSALKIAWKHDTESRGHTCQHAPFHIHGDLWASGVTFAWMPVSTGRDARHRDPQLLLRPCTAFVMDKTWIRTAVGMG